MARRRKKWKPIGQWLKNARKEAGWTLEDLAKRTGVSKSSLARFESNRAEPGFGDVCIIAQHLGCPLLYIASGHRQTGDDPPTLATHLRFWGLRDIRLAEPVLLGEVRAFEELFVDVVSRPVDPRLLGGLPALLLRNRFEPSQLISPAESLGSLRRVGWLANIATHISARFPAGTSQPDARRRLSALERAASQSFGEQEPAIDYLSAELSTSASARDRLWKASPPLTRRWRIACDIQLAHFAERAESILDGI
jgi:transcriptional regulator with XRE-family HTH domain